MAWHSIRCLLFVVGVAQLGFLYLSFHHIPHHELHHVAGAEVGPTRTTIGGVTFTTSPIGGTTAAWATGKAAGGGGGGGGSGSVPDVDSLVREARASSLKAAQLLEQFDSFKARHVKRAFNCSWDAATPTMCLSLTKALTSSNVATSPHQRRPEAGDTQSYRGQE